MGLLKIHVTEISWKGIIFIFKFGELNRSGFRVEELSEGNMEWECIEEECDKEELSETLDRYDTATYEGFMG